MKRRLWLLNIGLLVALVLLGLNLRDRWQEADARRNQLVHKRPTAVTPPATTPHPMVPKLEPNTYADVAQKVLFSRDRNPDVIPDPPPPPPPPKPVPPFPVAHGVMIWGDVPPTVILSFRNGKGGGEQQAYHAGDTVGEFEIASIDDEQIVFKWEGKTFVKNISDLEAAATPPPSTEKRIVTGMPPPAPAGAQPVQTMGAVQSDPASGHDVSPDGRTKTCDQNDPSPVGAVVNGYRKVAAVNPLAPNAHFCQWQAVN